MPPTETISLAMAPETLQALRESVAAGRHASLGQAVDEAVRAWLRDRLDHAERLDAIRARIRRSLDDPRPALSIEEVEANLEVMFLEARKENRRA